MKKLILIGFMLLGVVASSYDQEDKVSDIDVGNPTEDFSKSADSLVFSLESINSVLDEKRK